LSDAGSPKPAFIRGLSVLFALAAAFLAVTGSAILLESEMFSFRIGASLLGGFETAGPYAFLLGSALYALTAYGLWTLSNWARRTAIAIAAWGVFMAVPSASAAATEFNVLPLLLAGLPIIVRVVFIFYLMQTPIVDAFLHNSTRTIDN
jgi:hypothetical protein